MTAPIFLTSTVHATVQCTVGLNFSKPTTYVANSNFYCTSPPLVYMNTFLTRINGSHGQFRSAVVTPLPAFAVVVGRSVPTASLQPIGPLATVPGKMAADCCQFAVLSVVQCLPAIDQSPAERYLDLHPSPANSQPSPQPSSSSIKFVLERKSAEVAGLSSLLSGTRQLAAQ